MPRSTAIVASAIALGCIAYTHGDAQTPRSQSVSPRATASARDGIVPFKIRVPDDVLHERHDLLGDGHGHLVCPDLLRIARRWQRRGTEYRSSTGADGVCVVSEGDLGATATLGGGSIQFDALDGDAERRSFRRARRAWATGRKRPRVLSRPETVKKNEPAGVPAGSNLKSEI